MQNLKPKKILRSSPSLEIRSTTRGSQLIAMGFSFHNTMEGGVRVCGIAVLGHFWCGVAVIFISKYGIAVFRVQAVCGKFKFYTAVVGEKLVVSR